MSELSIALYDGLGLSYPKNGKKISADHNDLTRRVDGNTGRENGSVEKEELYQEVFAHRERYPHVLQRLYQANLEDPFESRPEINAYVGRLLSGHKTYNQLQKAILLFSAVIPPSKSFRADGYAHRGLTAREGGLLVHYNDDLGALVRKKHGHLLPKELFAMPQTQRIAVCLEYSFLLASLLRAADIQARVKQKGGHAYVIAILDRDSYLLDPAHQLFEKTNETGDPDRENVVLHYLNENRFFDKQGKTKEAVEALRVALEIKPNMAKEWNNLGMDLLALGKVEEALAAFDRALMVDPRYAMAMNNKAALLAERGRLWEAQALFDQALEMDGDSTSVWKNKGVAFYKFGRYAEALAAAEKALSLDPGLAVAWFLKGNVLLRQGKYEESLEAFDKLLELLPNSARTWCGKGIALAKLGKLEEAQRAFDRALEIDPGSALVSRCKRATLVLQQNK